MGVPQVPVTDDIVAEVGHLSRSTNRARVLEILLERGPSTKRALAEECDVVRTTLQRNLDALEERGLIYQSEVLSYALTDVELVVGPKTATTLRTDRGYTELVTDAFATGNFRVFVHEGPIPYFLGLLDDRVQIGVEDDESMPRALVESKSDAVRAWVEERYRSFKAAATRFS